MKKLILKTALLLAAALALPTSANAVVVWDWSWSGNGTGSGSLTTDDLSGGSYLITEMTGTWNGEEITTLKPPGGYFSNDNLLFGGRPQLDGQGLSFSTFGRNVNFFYGATYFRADGSGPSKVGTFTATIAPIPEPETYALMLAGLALVGAAARRRKAK